MTTPKTQSFSSSSDTKQIDNQRASMEKRQSIPREENTLVDDDVPRSTNLNKEANAYVFGLLPPDIMGQFEQELQQSQSSRDYLEEAKGFQEILGYWSDVPAPVGLAEKTLNAIQKEIAKENNRKTENDLMPKSNTI